MGTAYPSFKSCIYCRDLDSNIPSESYYYYSNSRRLSISHKTTYRNIRNRTEANDSLFISTRPTLQSVISWLREVYSIDVSAERNKVSKFGTTTFYPVIKNYQEDCTTSNSEGYEDPTIYSGGNWATWDAAMVNGVEKALELLVEKTEPWN